MARAPDLCRAARAPFRAKPGLAVCVFVSGLVGKVADSLLINVYSLKLFTSLLHVLGCFQSQSSDLEFLNTTRLVTFQSYNDTEKKGLCNSNRA